MIQHAPGYNLALSRTSVRVATGRRMARRVQADESPERLYPCLSHLCDGVDVIARQGPLDRPIEHLCQDSRRVSPGALFFALPGDQMDGSYYIHEAIERGAVAIVTEKSGLHHPRATFIQVSDARAVMAAMARRFFNFSAISPALVGVTGSHGKTCVAHLVQHLLRASGEPVGLLSSIHYDLGARVVPSYRTTPEAIDLYGMLAQMRDNGCRRSVLEISSRGLEQKRLAGLPLEVAVFLNLDREHARDHGGQDKYFRAKSRLFTGALGTLPKVAAVNLDDAWGRRLVPMIPEEVRVVTFGRRFHADIRAAEIVEGDGGALIRLEWPEGAARVRTRQLGSFAVSNLLAAVAAAYGAGVDLNTVLPRLLAFPGAPGRLEEINEGQAYRVLVDAARTPEAARHTLRAAREICDGRVLVVFGCRGNEPASGRARLVEAVQEEADFAWGTSDSPRNEPLGNIFDDMRQGVVNSETLAFVDDRRRAIALALDTAVAGDVVVLLGKGNQGFQYVGDAALPFDDRLVPRELLALREVALSTF